MKKQMLTILSLLALACSIPSDARAGAPAAKKVIPAECRASFVRDRGIEKRESTHGGPPQTPASERVAESEKLHLKARRLRKKAQKELAEARHELRAELGKLLKDPVMARGETSVYVVDAYSGRPLFAHNENVPLNPASNVKLVATAASLDAFGSRWRYETFFAGTRSLEKDAVHGDLYLVGSWDPTLKVNHLEKLVEELSLKGVDTISGDLVLTPGGLVRKGEAFELELAFLGKPSKRRIRSKKAAKDADPLAQVLFSEELPFLMIDSRVRVAQVSKTHLAVKMEVLSGGGGNTLNRENGAPLARIRVTGRIRPGDLEKVSVVVREPHVITARTLDSALRRFGVELKGTIRASEVGLLGGGKAGRLMTRFRLVSRRSPPISQLLVDTNKPSDNYLADSLTRTLGAWVFGGEPSMKSGVAAMKRWLTWRTGVDTRKVVLDTGSGLSYRSRLSTKQLVRILRVAGGFRVPTACPPKVSKGGRAFWVCGSRRRTQRRKGQKKAGRKSPLPMVFRRSLAVGKVDGTLRRRMSYIDLNGRLIGKTGTLNGISALTGFLSNGEGNRLAFSVVTNGAHGFRAPTIRRRHGWMVGYLDEFVSQRKEIYDNLRQAREIRETARHAESLSGHQRLHTRVVLREAPDTAPEKIERKLRDLRGLHRSRTLSWGYLASLGVPGLAVRPTGEYRQNGARGAEGSWMILGLYASSDVAWRGLSWMVGSVAARRAGGVVVPVVGVAVIP